MAGPSSQDPWTRLIWKTRISLGHIGIIMLIGGLVVSGTLIIHSNNEKIEYKKRLLSIQELTETSLLTTISGTEKILNNYEISSKELLTNFSNNYNELMRTIINQSDSALNAQLRKIKNDYDKVSQDLETQKDISYRYYFSEEWPFSDKEMNISGEMFFFIPIDISGLVDGTDRYIIWHLIENNGTFSMNQLNSLNDRIWDYLQPMKLSLSINFKNLEMLGVIKPGYWKNNVIEFTDEFFERLEVYKKYRGTDEYVKEMSKLYFKYR